MLIPFCTRKEMQGRDTWFTPSDRLHNRQGFQEDFFSFSKSSGTNVSKERQTQGEMQQPNNVYKVVQYGMFGNTNWGEWAYNALLSVNSNSAQSEAQGRLIRNYCLDTGLKVRLPCKWIPRLGDMLHKMRISGSDERVGTW